MKIKTHNYCITVSCNDEFGNGYKSSFCIKGISVNEKQALEIAKILFPSDYVEIISVVNKIVSNED